MIRLLFPPPPKKINKHKCAIRAHRRATKSILRESWKGNLQQKSTWEGKRPSGRGVDREKENNTDRVNNMCKGPEASKDKAYELYMLFCMTKTRKREWPPSLAGFFF